MDKKSIEVEAVIDDFPLSLNEMKVYVEGLIERYGGDAILEQDAGYNNISSKIKYSRLETEEEHLKRQEKESAIAKKQADKEMRQLERLASKHGKKII